MRIALAAAAMLTMFGTAEARTWRVAPGPEAQTELQHAFDSVEPGDTVRLDRGRYDLTRGLTLNISNIEIRGDGQDRTVLNFTGQQDDAAGIAIRANGVSLRDFAVEDTNGDAIVVRDCQGMTMRGMRAEWSRPASTGGYGLHAINCANVLIEQSIARGASAAGIGLSSSRTMIVRRNTAERNVAGIAVENGLNADLSENVATQNAVGVVVRNAPGAPQADGQAVRIFENTIARNNTESFAAANSPAAALPGGVGVAIIGGRVVHVFDNEIGGNATANVFVGAYGGDAQAAGYSPLPQDVMIRDNRFGGSGAAPAGAYAPLRDAGVAVMPDVLWDGADTFYASSGPRTDIVRLVLRDNRAANGGAGSFLSLGLNVAGAPLSEAAPNSAYPPVVDLPEPEQVRIRN